MTSMRVNEVTVTRWMVIENGGLTNRNEYREEVAKIKWNIWKQTSESNEISETNGSENINELNGVNESQWSQWNQWKSMK